jgi:arylformamidase
MVATDWQKLWPKVPGDLVPAGYAISGVFDLAPLVKTSMNQDFRLDAEEARRISPMFWTVPPGRTLDAVVGDLESSEFKRQSRSMADAWAEAKAETRYAELPGNHFTILDALADPQNAMVARIAELAGRVGR